MNKEYNTGFRSRKEHDYQTPQLSVMYVTVEEGFLVSLPDFENDPENEL